MLLGGIYGCESLAAHSRDEIPWEALPEDIVLQLHERADPALLGALDRHDFQVVAVARHPLDVLLSILHFARHDPSPARWLEDEPGDELGLIHASPLDEVFAEYAVGRRAQALLRISCQWWSQAEAVRVRYEHLCDRPENVLEALGGLSRANVGDVVANHTLDRLRQVFPGQHFWQGSPGHWRSLLPPVVARMIAEAHPQSFELLGYACDPDPQLTSEGAEENWLRIAKPATLKARDRAAAVRATNARDIKHLRADRFALLKLVERKTGPEDGAAVSSSSSQI
jgi:hypothetical protein